MDTKLRNGSSKLTKIFKYNHVKSEKTPLTKDHILEIHVYLHRPVNQFGF